MGLAKRPTPYHNQVSDQRGSDDHRDECGEACVTSVWQHTRRDRARGPRNRHAALVHGDRGELVYGRRVENGR